MDVSQDAESTKKQAKKWPAIVGAILATALAVLGAMGESKTPSHFYPEPDRDTGVAIERRLLNLERNDAVQSANIEAIKEDTHHTRDRVDRFLDSQGIR